MGGWKEIQGNDNLKDHSLSVWTVNVLEKINSIQQESTVIFVSTSTVALQYDIWMLSVPREYMSICPVVWGLSYKVWIFAVTGWCNSDLNFVDSKVFASTALRVSLHSMHILRTWENQLILENYAFSFFKVANLTVSTRSAFRKWNYLELQLKFLAEALLGCPIALL